MGKFSKDKGTRGERDFVVRLKREGITAKRVPLSGAMAGYKNDIILDYLGKDIECEVKLRADGFKELYKWIKPVQVLFVKANRLEGLAVLRLKDFAQLLRLANRTNELEGNLPIPSASPESLYDYLPSLLGNRSDTIPNRAKAN
jgi:Holliday junction resolvase